jgi:hypothetical protein
MNEKLNVRLGSPVVMFFWSFAMLLVGIVISAVRRARRQATRNYFIVDHPRR